MAKAGTFDHRQRRLKRAFFPTWFGNLICNRGTIIFAKKSKDVKMDRSEIAKT